MSTTLTRTPSFSARAVEYALQVTEGKIPACEWVKLACQRHLNDLEKYQGDDAPFYFDAEAADNVCDIVQHFPHIKGKWAKQRERLMLEPWQCFVVTVVFGWMCTATRTRRFRIAYIEVPRKNAKSTLTSAIGLYLLACDGEQGAHVVSAANTRDQAKIVFTDAQQMARREPGFLARCGVEVLAHSIVQQSTASHFEAISAEYSNLDGLNIHGALIDELHAHPNRHVWDVLETATVSRTQPLIWAITHAGVDRASVCYEQRGHVIDILNGAVEDDSYFGIIYTRDMGDDPYEEQTWIKANPNYAVSIYPESMHAKAKRARVMPSEQAAFFTNHLNIWVNAAIAWLPAGAWDRCTDPNLELEAFAHQPCFIGIDLASRSDMTALVVVFPPAAGRDWWAVFGFYYLPEETVNRSENTHYQGWEVSGRLIATEGAITDFDYLIDTLLNLTSGFDVIEIAIDPAWSTPLIVSMEKQGLPKPIEIRTTAPNMTPAMAEMEALVLAQKIRHDGDPVLSWMVSNLKVRRIGDLIAPTKESDEKKIDGVIGLLMCLNRAQRHAPSPDYENRGLWVF